MNDNELKTLLEKLKGIVDAWKEAGVDTTLQYKALENIEREKGASFKLVSAKYSEDVKKALVGMGTPFVEIPSGGNKSAFVVSTSAEGTLLSAQSKVMFPTPEYARYCTPQNIIQSAKEMGYKDVIRVSFSNRLACRMALEELYKYRIPTSIIEKDKENILYIHPEYLYRNGEPDFSDFRLKMAMYEAEAASMFGGNKSQFLLTKLKQVKYDEETLAKFANDVKEGRPTVYGDAFAKSPCYLESRNGNIVVNEKIDGEWVPKTIELDGNMELFEIKNICLSFLAIIKNAAVIPRKTWNMKFRDGNPDKTDEDVTSVMKERPKYSPEIKPMYKVQSTKLQKAVDSVIQMADKKVADKMGVVSVTNPPAMKEAYDMKAEEIIELLESGMLPEIKDFLEEEEGLTTAEKMQWLMDLSGAFDGSKKEFALKVSHGMASHEKVMAEIAKEIAKAREDKTEVKE